MPIEFAIPVAGGSLVGWESGQGVPMLVLHGGPLSDYTEPLVEVLPAGLRTIRYQQRGLLPSTEAGPFDVQTHVADAIAVLDGRGCEQVWLLGHSWGGHLAFHIAVARPDRVLGVIAVDALGAVPDGGWGALDANLFARLARASPEDAQRARQLDERMMAGMATVEEALESLRLVWPYYFANPQGAPPMPALKLSPALVAGVVVSVHQHFEHRTLERALPSLDRPFVLIHGDSDPLPAEVSRLTAALVPGATFELVRDAGHFPWLEQPEQLQAAVACALRPHL